MTRGAADGEASSKDRRGVFRHAFEGWSSKIRRRLALGHILTFAVVGLLVGACASAGLWHARKGILRPWTAGAGLVGCLAGWVVARRKRWSDEEVALYLDARLASGEVIATAVEISDSACAAAGLVIDHAQLALQRATTDKVCVPILRPIHATLPVALGAIVYMSALPLPPAPEVSAKAPGVENVALSHVEGLEKVIRLGEIDARDDAQRARLSKLAEDARRLREGLVRGMERREAKAELAKLKDGIAAERLSLGEGEQRQGMKSALGKLGENPELKSAARALGDRDLTVFDEEMAKLANRLEEEAREQAKVTLEEAAEAATRAGAKDVANTLEEQKGLLEQRGKKAERLKELAKALGKTLSPQAQEALRELSESGSTKSEQKLAEELEQALGKLTPEQRKQLAENLQKQALRMGKGGSKLERRTQRELEELAEQLATPEGQKALQEQLENMAQRPGPEGEGSRRQRGLDEAQRGVGQAEGQLGGVPMPMAGSPHEKSTAQPGQLGKNSAPQNGEGSSQSGHSEGGGRGSHQGQTGVIDGPSVKAHASSPVNRGQPMPGMVLGRTTGRAGETANLQGQGALGRVAPDELSGMDRSDVPEEYREQVGRYFHPK